MPLAIAQPVHSPGSAVPLWVGCYGWPGGQPASCYLTITSQSWQVDSNGHSASQHSTPVPSSAFILGNTGPYYHFTGTNLVGTNVSVTLKVGEREDWPNTTDPRKMIGKDEYLHACATPGTCANYSYSVGWQDIYWVEEKPQWIHIGATVKHMNSNSYNHWMTSTAAYGIYNTAVSFLAANPGQGKIAVNDMSLPRGGLFDINGTWAPSHWNHQRGKAVDVRSPINPYAVPDNKANEFINTYVLVEYASYGQVEVPPATAVQHIHCEWN